MRKLKQQYRNAYKRGDGWVIYPNVYSRVHKHFSTKQEKSYFFLHEIECKGYPIKLRAARGRALPDDWDDLPAYVYSCAKSWKHNSKRRNQYYR